MHRVHRKAEFLYVWGGVGADINKSGIHSPSLTYDTFLYYYF